MGTLGLGARRRRRRWYAGVAGLALTAHAWSAPVRLVELQSPHYAAPSHPLALAESGTEDAPTPLLDGALSPAEFSNAQLPDFVFEIETWDLDIGREFDRRGARIPLSRGAIALISRWVLTIQADDRVADLGKPALAPTLNEPRVDRVAETTRVWAAGNAGGGNPGGSDSDPAARSDGNPFGPSESPALVGALRPVVGFLRENREWALGISAALALLAAYASSQRGRR